MSRGDLVPHGALAIGIDSGGSLVYVARAINESESISVGRCAARLLVMRFGCNMRKLLFFFLLLQDKCTCANFTCGNFEVLNETGSAGEEDFE